MDAGDLPARELAAEALRALDETSASKLADAIGLTRRYQDRTVKHWLDGDSEPSYDSTLRLLTLVGLLPERLPEEWVPAPASPPAAAVSPLDGEAAGSAVVEDRGELPVLDRLAGLEGHVLGLIGQVGRLADQVADLAQQEPPRSRPAETERSG